MVPSGSELPSRCSPQLCACKNVATREPQSGECQYALQCPECRADADCIGACLNGVCDASGICGTDLALYSGDYATEYPLIMGHEFAGVVEAIGEDVDSKFMGARVTSEINLSCLTVEDPEPCPACRQRRD